MTVIEFSRQIAGPTPAIPASTPPIPWRYAMNSRPRRSFVLTTLLALLLGVSGAAALTGLAANPPNTKVAGIDVDATTIPKLQEFMNSRRMNSVELTNFYLRRIRELNPRLNAVITVSPTALA